MKREDALRRAALLLVDVPRVWIEVGDLRFTPKRLISALDRFGTVEAMAAEAERLRQRMMVAAMDDAANATLS